MPLTRRSAVRILAGLLGLGVVGLAGWWQATRPPAVAFGPDGDLRPNILVIDIDSLSPEYLGLTRNGAPITPNIDALMHRGTRFPNAFSHSGWTLPALGSILGGRLPVAIEASGGSIRWRPEGARDLPGILSLYGYSTAAFWGGTLPGPGNDANSRGFEHVSVEQKTGKTPPTAEVLRWVSDAKEPFFGYVHELDLNHPWAFLAQKYPYDTPRTNAIGSDYPAMYASYQHRLTEAAARDAMIAHYEGILHLYDASVGQMLAALDSAGVASRTIVVLTSDHGQDFFHHAYGDHGLLYDSTIRVPLVILDPRDGTTGAVVQTVVQGVDLAPTLLDRAGIPVDQTMDGRSLSSLMAPGDPPYVERPVYSLTDACHLSLRADGHKLILRDGRPRADRNWMPAGDAAGVKIPLPDFVARHGASDVALPDCSGDAASRANVKAPGSPLAGATPSDTLIELYDLAQDPDEQHNVAEDEPERALAMLRVLLATKAGQSQTMAGAPRDALGPDEIRKMREQGYWGFVGSGEKPAAPETPTP